MPLSHFAVNSTPAKFEETVTFYTKALAPLGYTEMANLGELVGFGTEPGKIDFWVFSKKGMTLGEGCGVHFAFEANDKEVVAAFHTAAVANGGKCNGPPGPRPQYGAKYFGAFVIDPMGNNTEAVSFDAE